MRTSAILDGLRDAMRLFRHSPGFSAVAVATVALAVGANTAMFGLVNGILLRPLPYPEPQQIVRVLERHPSGAPNSISAMNYLDWTEQNSVFEYIAAEAGWQATLTGADEPVLIRGARVSSQYFDIFGVTPALGRTFRPDEDQPGKNHVVLLSHVLWDSRFGSDPSLLGRAIALNGEPYTVVGILKKNGPFDRAAAQIWTPLAFEPSNLTRDYHWLGASARLAPGVTLEQARAEMDSIGQRLADAHPDSNRGWGVTVDRLADVLIDPGLRTAVTILFAATVFVLLIGCANLANLALARSISRRGETAVRAALGASRGRLVQQCLAEHIVISLCGGVLGVGVGYAMMTWIQSLIPRYALPPAVNVAMDTPVFLFTLMAAVATGLLFGVAPAMQASAVDLTGALKQPGHGTSAGGPGRRLRSTLVVAEIALAFVLLVASALLMRSVVKLLDIDPGFTATNVLTAGLPIIPEQHQTPEALNTYLASIRAAVETVPGVRKTALTSALPLEGWGFGMPYSIADRASTDLARRRTAFFKMVSPSYFEVLGIKLLAGRLLSDHDEAGSAHVAVINQTLARREFGDADPIGHRILARELVPGRTALGTQVAWEIVGVVAGERITGLGDEISAGMYVSNLQSPTYGMSLVVRTDVPPRSLQGSIRSAVDGVNRSQALSDVRTLEEIVAHSMLGNRTVSLLISAFASIALLLAALGIYGVMAYTTAQRSYEMGIRAALGASAGQLRGLVLGTGLRLTGFGLAIGLAGTFLATRVLSSMLYGIGAHDPLTLALVAVALSAVAAVACFVPAWRLTNVDPSEVLRRQ